MPDRLGEIESRMNLLAEQVRDMQARLLRLERAPVEAGPPAEIPAGDGEAVPEAWAAVAGTAGLVGRTFVVLGGAYLIRAITDAHLVPSAAGAAFGLAYAGWWLLSADRAARGGDRSGAVFHAVAGGLIALPLLWETTARFGLLRPRTGLLLVVAYLSAGLLVARRRALAPAALVLTFMALATVVALLVSTHDFLSAAYALLAIALVVETLAPEGRWAPLQWATGAVLAAVTVAMVALLVRRGGLPAGYVAISAAAAQLAALAVPALYLASLVVHTLFRGRQVTAFEATQVPLALLAGVGGAWALATAQGRSPAALGAVILVLGALAYGAAFLFAERRPGHARNFYFYGTAASVLTLVGTGALLAGPPLVFAGCGLAVAVALAGRRLERTTLALHGTVYLLAAALWTGFLDGSVRAVLAAATPLSAGWRFAPLFLSASATVYAVVATMRRPAPDVWWKRGPHLLAAFVVVLGTAGLCSDVLVRGLGGLPVAAVGMEATVGTAVLALVAVTGAAASARWDLPELGWLVHPVLVLGGLKLIAMDLRLGGPAALFLGFVLYGLALSVAPRLLRSRT